MMLQPRFDERRIGQIERMTHPTRAIAFRDQALTEANRLLSLKQPQPALAVLQKAQVAVPDDPKVLTAVARACILLGDSNAALQFVALALAQTPDDLDAVNIRAAASMNVGNFDDAQRDFLRIFDAGVGICKVSSNLGTLYSAWARRNEARLWFKKVLELEPQNATACYNLGLLDLLEGDFDKGWAGFECRFDAEDVPIRSSGSSAPRWNGALDRGICLFIYFEQGLGDYLQFVRFVPLVRARVGRVILEVPSGLHGLLADWAEDVELFEAGRPIPQHDKQVSIMSLASVLKLGPEQFSLETPYLQPVDFSSTPLFDKTTTASTVSVGLVWAGNPGHPRDRERSLHLAALRPLLDIPRTKFYAFQAGASLDQISDLNLQDKVTVVFPEFKPMSEVAACLGKVDLLISVDTALAHLAGAIGIPTWTMITHVPDWRWMLSRTDTPWYPSMKLYRQPERDDWNSVVQNIRTDLIALTPQL